MDTARTWVWNGVILLAGIFCMVEGAQDGSEGAALAGKVGFACALILVMRRIKQHFDGLPATVPMTLSLTRTDTFWGLFAANAVLFFVSLFVASGSHGHGAYMPAMFMAIVAVLTMGWCLKRIFDIRDASRH